jgi:hypothetical protein
MEVPAEGHDSDPPQWDTILTHGRIRQTRLLPRTGYDEGGVIQPRSGCVVQLVHVPRRNIDHMVIVLSVHLH